MLDPSVPVKWVDDPTLPIQWKGFIQPSGSLYFCNPVTNVTQYERPSAPQYHHQQFYLGHNPYPWLPTSQYSGQDPKPLSTTTSINYPPQHRPIIREEGQDRISGLPDELISHILGFLPTISAVRTSILSKRWNRLWTSVRRLDFDIVREMFRYRTRFESFVQFVLLRLTSSDIQKFRLRYANDDTVPDSTHLADWVSVAVWRKVVELDLQILYSPGDEEDNICRLPQSIFCCKTLTVLKLWLDYEITIPEPDTPTGCFPSLKIFHLTMVDPHKTMGRLLSYFPVLEDLSIHGHVTYSYNVHDNINVTVSAPELKTLRLSMERAEMDSRFDDKYYGKTPKKNSFCVNAPKLENLEVIQIPLSHYILDNPKSVVNARIAFKSLAEEEWPSFPDRAYQLLTELSNVNCLSLSDQPFEASHLPVFGNLNRLRLVLLRNRNSWEFLTKLLHKTPNLEGLDIVLDNGTEGEKVYQELQWNLPELVPYCLSSNLKTISIRGFKGLLLERQVAKYMLMNGCHLNKMTIYTCILEKEESYRDLLTFKRAMTCKLDVREMRL